MNERRDIFAELNAIASNVDVWGYLEEQRSHVPKAHQAENDTNYLTKKAITAAKSGDCKKIAQCVEEMLEGWRQLGALNIPGDFRWQRDGETAQELIEALGVLYYYSDIFGGTRLLKALPYPEPTKRRLEELKEELGVEDVDDVVEKLWIICGITPQRWLAGYGDVPGELGKLTHDYLLDNPLSLGERIKLLENFLHVAKHIYQFLEQGNDFPGQVIDNSRRRFFENTYRGKLGRVGRIIDNTKLEILQMKNIASAHEAHGLTRKEV